MKKVVIVIVAIVLAVGIAAGSFYGGMAYERTQANSVRNAFLRSRGLSANGNGSANGQGSNGARGFFGGGVTGQVKSLNGNTLQISTAQNVTTVTLSSSTVIDKTTAGATTDLQPGDRVLVTGSRDSSGNVTATQVLILPAMPSTTGNTNP